MNDLLPGPVKLEPVKGLPPASGRVMRISLVRPYNSECYSFVPPLGLGYLAAILKRGGYEVSLFDAVRDRLPSVDRFEQFLALHTPDIVGIQLYSVDLDVTRRYLEAARKANPRPVTVVGGPHPSALPEETMRDFGEELLDFIVAGEAEYGLLGLADALAGRRPSYKNIPGLVWRDGDNTILMNDKSVISDLDQLPWPDWQLLDPGAYPHAPQGGFVKGFPLAPISISRGCPMDCTFCGGKSIYGRGFRFRDIDSVIAEIKHLVERFGVKEIMVQDDNLTYRKALVLEFCEKIGPLNIHWNCLNGIRLNFIDDEIAGAMKESGCYSVGVGIESGSQRILDDMRKQLTLDMVREKIAILVRRKILVSGLFIIGYPTETREDVLKTIAFAKSLNIDKAVFTNFLPLPGSAVFEELRRTGRLRSSNLSEMSYYRARRSYAPALAPAELDALLKRAMREFYFRPRVIFRLLKRIGSFSNLLNIGKRFFKNYV